MLRALMDKEDNMQAQMGNVIREMKILTKHQKEVLKVKKIVIEVKNYFVGLISRLDRANESSYELEDISIEFLKI